MKSLLSFLFFLTSLNYLFSQSGQLDSLEILYGSATSDDRRFEILEQMTDEGSAVDISTGLKYAQRGSALAEKTNNATWKPKFYGMQGRMHANLSNLDSAVLYFDKAMVGFVSNGNKKGQASIYFKMAWVNRHKGELKQAMESDLKALRVMEELKDQTGTARALESLSDDMSLQHQQDEALDYALKAIDVCDQHELKDELPFALRTAGDAYIAKYKFEEALSYYDRSLDLFKKMNSISDIADVSNCRGNALKRLGRYEEALKEYQVCLEISEKLNYQGGISTAIANLGEVNLLKENYKEALPYQLKTMELQEKAGDLYNITENLGHLSTIYEHLGDYKTALGYERRAYHMRDSIIDQESDKAISELRTQYETEKNEATIASQEEKIGIQSTLQWLYIGIAVLLGLFAFSFYRNGVARKKTNTQLSAKNAENELLLKEIHHRVKNNLEVVSSLLALQSAQISDPGIKDAMQEGQNRVQSIGIVHQKLYQGANLAAVEMKDYFINLSDSILDSFGAEDRITIECAMNNLELDIDTAVPLGLITNEILTNALKYAFPDGRKGHIEIKLERKADNMLQLKIADDGIGKSGVVHGTGFGGQLVMLLTRQLSGSMREEIKGGTAVYIDFAMKKIA